MNQYKEYLSNILKRGTVKSDRTGVGTVSAFGHFLEFDLADGFPLLGLKRTSFKSIVAELLWFLEGSTDNERLHELGATIWDEWATETGELGPIYGYQWRSWPLPFEKDPRNVLQRVLDAIRGVPPPTRPYDQIREIQYQLRVNPTSRRLVLTGWNPQFLPDPQYSPQENVRRGKQALPPCHMSFIFNASVISINERIELGAAMKKFGSAKSARAGLDIKLKGCEPGTVDSIAHDWLDEFDVPKFRLNGLLTQRSSDAFLGAPYNIASYGLLIHMMAQSTGMVPGKLSMAIADGHIYLNHLDFIEELLSRDTPTLPQLELNPDIDDIDDFTSDDITLVNYVSHPPMKAPVAV